MKKTAYQKEINIPATQRRFGSNRKKEVMKIQSWLTLFAIRNPESGTATAIDGDFGPATEQAVKRFQYIHNITSNGIVTQDTFKLMCANMIDAFEKPLQSTSFRDLIIEAAENHLLRTPQELVIKGQSNSGPWVRSYMDGNDGSPWFWCMGFVQTIIDQAASALNKNFRTLMPQTYSCDTLGMHGLHNGLLFRYQKIRRNEVTVQPGDIFLYQKSKFDWTHTGIIIDIEDDTFTTIEGNTNHEGSRNGIAVMKRTRNFRKSKLDVFSVAPFT